MVKSKQTDQVYSLKGKVKATTPKAVLLEYWREGRQFKDVWIPRSIAGDPLIIATCIVGEEAEIDIPQWFLEKNGLEDYVL